MSSAQEYRQKIIYENIPKLIKSLTGFNETDENFVLCENYAYSKIVHHRYLSVNSHDVRRRINGLAERFLAANYAQYGERLKELCDTLTTDETCLEHYEIDIHWKILQLLLDISRNPVAALAENKDVIRLTDTDAENDLMELEKRREREIKMNDLISSLVGQNIHDNDLDDSELSEWSVSEDDESSVRGKNSEPTINLWGAVASTGNENQNVELWPQHKIQPPQKPLTYTEFDTSNSLEFLKTNIQPAWWSTEYQAPVSSALDQANFCQIYRKQLITLSGGLLKPPPVTILSEWCLMREIIWMLLCEPTTSDTAKTNTTSSSSSQPHITKQSVFFSLNVSSQEITVNRHVSLSSVTDEGIQELLMNFAKYMTYLYRFRLFFASVFNLSDSKGVPPYSVECYAVALREFTDNISTFLLKIESELVESDPMKPISIVRLYNELTEHFRLLNYLYDIHKSCYLDYKCYSAHVCSMHLLSSLLKKVNTAPSVTYLNLAASLFLVSVKYYMTIFNNWWLEGRFDDWRQEFLVESIESNSMNQSSNNFKLRSLNPKLSKTSDDSKEPLSQSEIIETIKNSEFIELLNKEALEAGYIFNILYNLDKLTEMKEAFSQEQNNQKLASDSDFYDIVLRDIFNELEKFSKDLVPKNEQYCDADDVADDGAIDVESERSSSSSGNELNTEIEVNIANCGIEAQELIYNKFCSDFSDMENKQLLYMIFEDCLNDQEQRKEDSTNEHLKTSFGSCLKIYERLNNITDFHLPFEIFILNVLRSKLRSRISIANQLVLRIYKNEYNVLQHIFNLQKVFLFGAGDLMLTFYSKLFKSMNLGENWNNSYLLTVQLNEILASKYPDVNSLFSIQLKSVNCGEKEPLDAIKDIVINYSVRDSLRDIIHDKSLKKYNSVFTFILQIKWAIWTLETLRFPIYYKKRRPYMQLTMIDLTFKRLALVRNWIIYSIQCIHSHLMTFVIQSMGQQFIKKIEKAECLREIIDLHDTYIQTIYEFCFRRTSDAALRNGIEQLLNLVVILNDEWQNIESLQLLEEKGGIDSDVVDQRTNSSDNLFNLSDAVAQVDNVEATYINCHCYIAEMLSAEVYTKDRTDLSALSAAFNSSCPY